MTELDLQQTLPELLARFVWELRDKGFFVTMGECYRPPETCELMAKEGKGIVHSLHTERRAFDLCLFKGTEYLTTKEQYQQAGDLWKSYSCAHYLTKWGGDFSTRIDADHFEIHST